MFDICNNVLFRSIIPKKETIHAKAMSRSDNI